MNLKSIITAASLALLPLTAGAASLIIPAAGTGPGANGSQWQSEVTLHNTSSVATTATLTFHDAAGASDAVAIALPAHATTSIADVVRTKFGRTAATGAIEVALPDADFARVAITSRTFNVSSSGEFGQDIPAVKASDAAAAGDLAVLTAPSSVASYRFNFGLYAVADADVTWQLIRADGTVAAQKDVSYAGGTQIQYASGVSSLLGAEAKNDDVVQASVTKGSAIFYGSAVNNASGDPTFVPGVKTRQEIRINFAGVDLDENGTVDIKDADRDGVLDAPIDIFTTNGFPNYFRLVASGEHGEPATFQLLDSGTDAQLIDANGTVAVAPGIGVRGQSGSMKVRITAGGTTAVVTLPLNYR
jgi:hypothetical protein